VSGGRSAILGFEYQVVVTLDILLFWFEKDASILARPEGDDDFTIQVLSDIPYRHQYQVKKPRETSGEISGKAWTLTEVASELLLGTFQKLEGNQDQQTWVLGDPIHADFQHVLQAGKDSSLRNSQPFLRIVHTLARQSTNWQGSQEKLKLSLGQWRSKTELPGNLESLIEEFRGFAVTQMVSVKSLEAYEQKAHDFASKLPDVLSRIQVRATAGSEKEIETRVQEVLRQRYNLQPEVIQDTLYRNLRVFIYDVAKQKDRWFGLEEFEIEVRTVWPTMNLVVLPQPLETSILSREHLVHAVLSQASASCFEIVGISGAGKTTFARELFAALDQVSTTVPPFFIVLKENSALEDLLIGLSFHLRGYGDRTLFGLLTQPNQTNETIFKLFADTMNSLDTLITVLIDVESGTVNDNFAHDLAKLIPQIESGSARFIVFAQAPVLRFLSTSEKNNLSIPSAFELPGFSFEEFLLARQKAQLAADRSFLWSIYEHFTRGRASGLEAYFVASLVRLSDDKLQNILQGKPEDGIRAATRARFDDLPESLRLTAEHLLCFALPFTRTDAETAFLHKPVASAIEALLDLGLLRRYDATRFEMHEMVRSGLEQLLPAETIRTTHEALARMYQLVHQQAAVVHHLMRAGLPEEAFMVARAAMTTTKDRNSLWDFILDHDLIDLEQMMQWLLNEQPNDDLYLLPKAIAQRANPDTATRLLEFIHTHTERFDRDWNWASTISETILLCDPTRLVDLLKFGLEQSDLEKAEFDRLQRITRGAGRCDVQLSGAELSLFDQADPGNRWRLLPTLMLEQKLETWDHALRWVLENDSLDSSNPIFSRGIYVLKPRPDSVGHLLEALPCPQASQLLSTVGLGFGRLTAWIWHHRRVLQDGATEILQKGGTDHQALNALRVLAFLGDPQTLVFSRAFWGQESELGAFAYLLPTLMLGFADPEFHRQRLFDLALPPNTRLSEFKILVSLGENPGSLLKEIESFDPSQIQLWQYIAVLCAMKHPFPDAIQLLEKQLFDFDNQDSQVFDSILPTLISNFPSQAQGLLERCLREGNDRLRACAYLACWYARHRGLLQTIIAVGSNETNPKIVMVAAWAAIASGPSNSQEIEPILMRSPDKNLLKAITIGRTSDLDGAQEVVRLAMDKSENWPTRRAAIAAAGTLQYETALQSMLPLLQEPFSLDIDASRSLRGHAGLILLLKFFGPAELESLMQRGRIGFLDFLTPMIQESLDAVRTVGFPSQAAGPLAEWLFGRLQFHQASSNETRFEHVLNELHTPVLHAAILRSLRQQKRYHELDALIPSVQNEWQLMRTVIERFKDSAPNATELASLKSQIAQTSFAHNIRIQNVLNELQEARPIPVASPVSILSVIELEYQTVLTTLAEDSLTADVPCIIRNLTQAEFRNLVRALRPTEDSVQTLQTEPTLRLSGTDFFVRNSVTSQSGTDRSKTRQKLRGALVAANRFNLPVFWYSSELEINRNFLQGFVESLGAQGDANIFFEVLERDGPALFSQLGDWRLYSSLCNLIDIRIVPWLLRFVHAGNDNFLETLCAFSACVQDTAIDPVLTVLWERVLHRLNDQSRTDVHLAWRAFQSLVDHPRTQTIPNRFFGLQTLLRHEKPGFYRDKVIDALQDDPLAYVALERESLITIEFEHFWKDRIDTLDNTVVTLFKQTI
jgi:hypothetical protein